MPGHDEFCWKAPFHWLHFESDSQDDADSFGCRLEHQRIDKWLWHARVVKARTSAAELVESGHVRVNGARDQSPGHAIKTGDLITVPLDRTVRVLKVIAFTETRRDAASPPVLYRDLSER